MPDSEPHAAPSHLSEMTGFLLRSAYLKAADCAQACISETAPPRELTILAILDERGPLSQRQLCDLLQVNRTIMVKLVDNLEERGWVIRDRNPNDRRSYALRVTEVGTKSLDGFRGDLDQAERVLTKALTPRQRNSLRKELLALLDGEHWMSIDSLTGHAGFLITQAHRMIRDWATRELEPVGLDPRDFGVLVTLWREQPCSQNHLAQVLGVSAPAALSFVEQLEATGLVHRERNANDRRFYDLTLTPAGQQRLKAARKAAGKVQQRIAARLGERGDAELRRLLTRVITAPVEGVAPPEGSPDLSRRSQRHT